MTLSIKAWALSAPIFEAIKTHAFNQELMNGTLARDKFAYYIEQDTHYLHDFARCLALIAAKAPLQYVRDFLRYSDYAFIAEQEVVHQFFKKTFHFKETGHITPATLSYTSYLLRLAASEPVEIAIAAVLPCFWVYREIGLYISQNTVPDNPFQRWIDTYASDEFRKSVDEAINIFNTLAEQSSQTIQQKMLDAFYTSTCLEWHFWNDSYHQTIFDRMIKKERARKLIPCNL